MIDTCGDGLRTGRKDRDMVSDEVKVLRSIAAELSELNRTMKKIENVLSPQMLYVGEVHPDDTASEQSGAFILPAERKE